MVVPPWHGQLEYHLLVHVYTPGGGTVSYFITARKHMHDHEGTVTGTTLCVCWGEGIGEEVTGGVQLGGCVCPLL